MEETNQITQTQQSIPPPIPQPVFTPQKTKNTFLFILGGLLVIALIATGTYAFLLQKNQVLPSKIPPITTVSKTSQAVPTLQPTKDIEQMQGSCTKDTDCTGGRICQTVEGIVQGTSGGTEVVDGHVVSTPVPTTPPTITIIKGICLAKEGMECKSETDCAQGLVCHPSGTKNTCQKAILGTCSGSGDTSCGAGYQCVKGCDGPIYMGPHTTPASYCEADELAAKPRTCPICLASNTLIDTPDGQINVTNIHIGDRVWSVTKTGEKIISKVVKVGSTTVPVTHHVIHLILSNRKAVWVSPNHPTSDNRTIGELHTGDKYNNATVISADSIQYWDKKTYDILPDSDTGFYFADGILLGSTLK